MVGVLIGLPGQWAEDELESSDHYTTKIGGLPDWPPLPDNTLKPELLNCCSCGSKLSLVAQVYAPISEMKERTLYIFGCLMLKCGTSEQSWRAFSVWRAINEKESIEIAYSPLVTPSKAHWLDDNDDDDDDDEEDFDFESLAKAIAEAATNVVTASNSKKQNKKPNGGNATSSGTKVKSSPLKSETRVAEIGAVVPCFYVYTKEEKVSKEVDRVSMNYSSMSIKDKETDEVEGSEEVWEDEKYEYDKALNADRTYLKFKKRLDANSEQCFRYSYGGKPLLATDDLKSPDKCVHCESSMVFEMQLMPPLIYFLHEAVVDNEFIKQSLDNWDWMTLIVFTCSKSCANAVNGDWVVAEEFIAVQYEKPMNLDHSSFFK